MNKNVDCIFTLMYERELCHSERNNSEYGTVTVFTEFTFQEIYSVLSCFKIQPLRSMDSAVNVTQRAERVGGGLLNSLSVYCCGQSVL